MTRTKRGIQATLGPLPFAGTINEVNRVIAYLRDDVQKALLNVASVGGSAPTGKVGMSKGVAGPQGTQGTQGEKGDQGDPYDATKEFIGLLLGATSITDVENHTMGGELYRYGFQNGTTYFRHISSLIVDSNGDPILDSSGQTIVGSLLDSFFDSFTSPNQLGDEVISRYISPV